MAIPVVTVVMGVRNGRSHLGAAIASILDQSLTELELVVVDDGSSDGSAELVRARQRLDSRIVLESSNGRGLAAALNAGISVARGEWIARMDADDVSLRDRLARQLDFVRTESLDICGCDIRTFGSTIPRVRSHSRQHDAIRLEMMFRSPFAHPTVFGRRALFLGGYDESSTAAQDFALWTKLAIQGVRMGNLGAPLLKYRIHHRQTTAQKAHEQIRVAVAAARDYWRHVLSGAKLPETPYTEEQVLRSVFDKSVAVADDVAVVLAELFQALISVRGDPEGVLSRNAFDVLIRASSEVRGTRSVAALVSRLGPTHRMMLLARSMAPVSWESPGIRLARRLLR